MHFSSSGNERILFEVSSVVVSGLGVVVGGSVGLWFLGLSNKSIEDTTMAIEATHKPILTEKKWNFDDNETYIFPLNWF